MTNPDPGPSVPWAAPRRPRAVLVALVLLLGGCATTVDERRVALDKMMLSPEVIALAKKEGEVELADDSRIVCRKEMPTGSHLAKWRCETVAGKADSERDNQQRMTERVMRGKPRVGD